LPQDRSRFKKKLDEKPSPQGAWKPRARWVPGLMILTLTVFMGFFEHFFLPIRPPVVGRVSQQALRAPYDFVFDEETAIREVVEQELAGFAPIYLYDPKRTYGVLTRLDEFFSVLAECRQANQGTGKGRACVRDDFDTPPGDQAVSEILKYPHLEELQSLVTTTLSEQMGRGILSDQDNQPGLNRLRVQNLETGVMDLRRVSQVARLSETREMLGDHLEVLNLRAGMRNAIRERINGLVEPNLTFAREQNEQELAHIRAMSSAKKLILYRRGDLLIIRGEIVSPLDSHRVLACLAKARPNAFLVGGASFIPFLLLTLVFVFICQRMGWTNRSPMQGYLLVFFVLLSVLLLAKVVFLFTNLSAFAIPVAAAGLLVALLIDPPAGLLAALMTAIYATFLTNLDMGLFIYYLVGGVVLVLGVKRSSKRLSLLFSSALVGVLNALLMVCTLLLRDELPSEPLITQLSLQAFLSGPAAWLLATLLSPVGERLFRLATADRLRELCDLNHPLLRRLQEKAPGTYYHSLAVANIATAAAEAVKADALLVRAGAYYHDVGKMMQSEYFIENQSNKDNPHDALDAVTSSRIVKGHVSDGTAIAREYGLPQAVISLIAEHHGATVMEGFFAKAQETQPKVPWNPDFFRYDGPKPGSLEAGILMIADVTEAVGRLLQSANPLEVREKVHELIVRKFEDGQFDLCNLPTATIALVETSVTQTLLGILHKRIEYPKNNLREVRQTED